MLQAVSILLVIYSFFLVRSNIPTLPSRIPMHFNSAGMANGWGSPETLWILVGAQAMTCAIFLLVPYLGQMMPGAIHFGHKRLSDFPEAQRPQILRMLMNMSASMNVVMNLFMVTILRQVLDAAKQSNPQIRPILPLVVVTTCLVGILIFYLMRIQSAGKNANPAQEVK